MSNCVCGHSEADHRTVDMSVPLTNPTPVYKILGAVNGWASNATYTHDPCWCGCTLFDPDKGDL